MLLKLWVSLGSSLPDDGIAVNDKQNEELLNLYNGFAACQWRVNFTVSNPDPVVEHLLLLVVCLLLGIVFRWQRVFPDKAPLVLNQFIIYVALPAIALLHIPQLQFNATLLFPVCTAWIVFLAALVLFVLLGRALRLDRATVGCLVLTCGLFNSSFVGFPVVEALYGKEGLQMAIMVDQPGSFIVLSTLGIVTAAWFSSGKTDMKFMLKKVFGFPPLLAFILALVLKAVNFQHTGLTEGVLTPLAATIIPLALVSVGMQLKPEFSKQYLKPLLLGLGYRLWLSPFIIFALYVWVFDGGGLAVQVSLMEAAMAPMITGAIVAQQYDLKPKLASMIVGVGIPLSFLTLVFWYWVAGQL